MPIFDPKSEDYLNKCHDAWTTVFDNFDQLLRTFRSMSPNLSADLTKNLNELKRNIEDKREDLEQVFEKNLDLVRTKGLNIQETPPMAVTIDFSMAKYLKAAWPTTTPVKVDAEPRSPSPFETASSSIHPVADNAEPEQKPEMVTVTTTRAPPPGFDRIVSWVQTVDNAPPPKKPESKPIPVPTDDFDDFDGIPQEASMMPDGPIDFQLEPMKKKLVMNDFDDFEPFGEPSNRCVSAPLPPLKQVGASSSQAVRLPSGDPAQVHETMRCVDFLTNKIRQKYGEKNDAALTKVYGHLSEEKSYRMLVGGLKEFPDFLARFPDIFKLSKDQQLVQLAPNAVKKSGDAVKLAKRLMDEVGKKKQRKPSESSNREPPRKPPSPIVKAVPKPTPDEVIGGGKPRTKSTGLMEMDDYGDSGSSIGGDDGSFSDGSSSVENRNAVFAKSKQPQSVRQLKNYNKK